MIDVEKVKKERNERMQKERKKIIRGMGCAWKLRGAI